MKKAAIILMAMLVVPSAMAATARISNTPGEIVLKPGNDYDVKKTFDGTGSSPDSVTYSWSIEEAGVSESGPDVSKFNYTFDTTDSKTNTVKLIVTSNTDSSNRSITKTLRDVPDITGTSVSETSIDLKSEDTVDFSVSADDTFDDTLSYQWTFSNGTVAGTGASNAVSFGSTGEYTLTVNITDGAGYYASKQLETVSVEDTSSPEDDGGGGGGSISIGATPANPAAKIVEAARKNGVNVADIGGVEKEQSVEISLPEQSRAIEKISLTAKSASEQVNLEVEDLGAEFSTIEDSVGERPSGVVEGYQRIDITGLADSDVGNASVSFRASKSFLEKNNATPENVRLQRYSNGWEKYSSERIGETETAYRFESEVPGFSYYAVTLEQEQQETGEDSGDDSTGEETGEDTEQEVNNTPTGDGTDGEGSKIQQILIVLLVILTMVVLIIIVERNRGQEFERETEWELDVDEY